MMIEVMPKFWLSVALSPVAALFGEMGSLVSMMFIVICLDYLSGLIAGRMNEGLNSPRALKGL